MTECFRLLAGNKSEKSPSRALCGRVQHRDLVMRRPEVVPVLMLRRSCAMSSTRRVMESAGIHQLRNS